MDSKTYDRMKWVALVLLPALATLYFGLGEIWHVPAVQEVVATITLLDTFLGLLLGRSASQFREKMVDGKFMGDVVVVQDFDGTPTNLRVDVKDKTPVFPMGGIVSFRVKGESLE